MKRIELHVLPPTKFYWEIAILPNINFGYSYKRFYMHFAWLLWSITIIIEKSK